MAQVGLKNLYYALMVSDEDTKTKYEKPVKIGNAVSVDINPTVNRAQLYGDDMAVAAHVALSEITVTIETTEIPLDALGALLGSEMEGDALVSKGSDSAPYVALLFESETHDGKTRCIKLLKGKFAPTQETINTRGESIEYQVPKLEGVFVSRASDGAWRKMKDYEAEADTEDWYKSVEGEDDEEDEDEGGGDFPMP